MSENDTDARIRKGEKIIRKNLPIAKDINVSINTSNIEKLIEHNKELELENRQLREGKVPTKEEFEEEAEFERKLRLLSKGLKQVEQEDAFREASEENLDIELQGDKSSTAGVLKLTPEQIAKERGYSPEKGFRSYEEMIDYLAENDPSKLAELKQKWHEDIEAHAQRQPSGKIQFVWRDPFLKNPETGKPESVIKRILRKQNEKKRRKALGDKE
jgi:hypothetical protein